MQRLHIATCAGAHHRLAFVATLAALSASASEIQLLPAGEFRGIDGRPEDARAWKITAELAQKLIASFDAKKNDLAIDYEHQTFRAQDNGQPAPAAGWIKSLEWREGKGLFAKVEWTERAKAAITSQEYRYISPTFAYDKKTGEVKELMPAALVNYPALDGMQEVALSALARGFDQSQETEMNPLLVAVLAALGLTETTKPEEATTAIATIKAKAGEADALKAKVTDLETKAAKVPELEQSIAALKAGAPDPAKFVPIEQVKTLQTQVAALTAAGVERELNELVTGALDSGKLLPDMEKWARDLGKKDIAQLKAYLESAAPIAALAGTQTGGRRPTGSGQVGDANAIAKAASELMDKEQKAGRVITSADAVQRVSSGTTA